MKLFDIVFFYVILFFGFLLKLRDLREKYVIYEIVLRE